MASDPSIRFFNFYFSIFTIWVFPSLPCLLDNVKKKIFFQIDRMLITSCARLVNL